MTDTAYATRAGYEDEIAYVGVNGSSPLDIGDEVDIADPRTGGKWLGTVIDIDTISSVITVRVDTDSFMPPVSDFEETGPEAQRQISEADLDDLTDFDFFEDKASGHLYTWAELRRMVRATEIDPFFT